MWKHVKTPHFGWPIHVLRIQSTGLLAFFKSPFVDTCCALSASVYEESPSKSLAPSRWFFSSCNGSPSKYVQLSHLIPFVRLVNHGQSMSPCSKGGQDITWDFAKISPSEGSRATSCAECSESFSWRCCISFSWVHICHMASWEIPKRFQEVDKGENLPTSSSYWWMCLGADDLRYTHGKIYSSPWDIGISGSPIFRLTH